MSKFKISLAIYLFLLILIIALFNDNLNLLIWIALGLTILYMLLLLAMSMLIHLNFYINSTNVNANQKVVLTFDDGPHPKYTLDILSILDELNVKAVFFMIGSKVKAYPEIAKEVARRGHDVGVHSQTHPLSFGWLRGKKLATEISDCVHQLELATGKTPVYFRPPFGVTSPRIAKEVLAQNLHLIGWSVRSFDTVTKSADAITKRVIADIKANSIVLLHDRMPETANSLPQIVKQIRSKGLNFGALTINLSSG